MEHLVCARWCSSCWACGGEQNGTWFHLLGIYRLDRSEDEAVYSHRFHHFMISWSDRCLLSFQPKCCSSFKSVFQWPSLSPASWLMGDGALHHTHWGMRAPYHLNHPVKNGLMFLGLEIRPGQLSCLLHTLVHLPGRAGVFQGIWLNIKIKSAATSFPIHLSHLTSHSHFLCPVFLVVEWPKSHLAVQEGAQHFLFLSKCVLRCTARQ